MLVLFCLSAGIREVGRCEAFAFSSGGYFFKSDYYVLLQTSKQWKQQYLNQKAKIHFIL